jgi:hypothetical protein
MYVLIYSAKPKYSIQKESDQTTIETVLQQEGAGNIDSQQNDIG